MTPIDRALGASSLPHDVKARLTTLAGSRMTTGGVLAGHRTFTCAELLAPVERVACPR